jgi:hypothetical protein
MRQILRRDEFLKEALWKGVIDRSKSDKAREEDENHHHFTDGNGKIHKHGILVEDNIEQTVPDVIGKYILDQLEKGNYDIDLNILDMSEVKSIQDLFHNIKVYLLYKSIPLADINKIKLDCSGWLLDTVQHLRYAFNGLWTDIGIENWKFATEKQMDYTTFKNSWYEDNLPSWYEFNPKDWASTCIDHISKFSSRLDKVRTKELGKTCYLVKFKVGLNDNLTIEHIPDVVTIESIIGEYTNRVINCQNLKSFERFPKEFDPYYKFMLELTLKKFDEEIVLPKGLHKILIKDKNDDITRLPKVLDCGIHIYHSNVLVPHFEEVKGDFKVNFYGSGSTSLDGFPKVVGGEVELSNYNGSSLKDCPESVGGDFIIRNCPNIDSLQYCPKFIGKRFDITNTPKLNKFDFFPDVIKGDISFEDLKLDDFEGLPDTLNNKIYMLRIVCNKSFKGLPTKTTQEIEVDNFQLNNTFIQPEDLIPKLIEDNPNVNPDLFTHKIKAYNNK